VRTHFYPTSASEDAERGPCGTWLGEASNLTGDWGRVDCRRCIRSKARMMGAHAAEERAIVEQMGDMANFMKSAAGERND
jgi:hypothetical protein